MAELGKLSCVNHNDLHFLFRSVKSHFVIFSTYLFLLNLAAYFFHFQIFPNSTLMSEPTKSMVENLVRSLLAPSLF